MDAAKLKWAVEQLHIAHPPRVLDSSDAAFRSCHEALSSLSVLRKARAEAGKAWTCAGMFFSSDELKGADGDRIEKLAVEVASSWREQVVGRFPELQTRVQCSAIDFGLLQAPALEKSPRIAESCRALVAAVSDARRTSELWEEPLCFAVREAPADQPMQLHELAKRLDSRLPPPLEALYAELDGLHVFLGQGGRAEWEPSCEPFIRPLGELQRWDGKLAFGFWGRSSLMIVESTAAVVRVSWDRPGAEHLSDSLEAFLAAQAQSCMTEL